MLDNILSWSILCTRPRHERKVGDLLRELEIEYYFPETTVTRQWSDRKKKIRTPLFPNYVFVKIDPSKRYEVLMLPGAIKFLSFGGRYAQLSDDKIDAIQESLSFNPQVVNSEYVEGARVLIKKPPFNGIEGNVVERKGQYRLAVSIEGLGKTLLMDVSACDLASLEAYCI